MVNRHEESKQTMGKFAGHDTGVEQNAMSDTHDPSTHGRRGEGTVVLNCGGKGGQSEED